MLAEATTTYWVDCTYSSDGVHVDGCHTSLYGEMNCLVEDVDVEEWVTENGWLWMGENGCYCPECKKHYFKELEAQNG